MEGRSIIKNLYKFTWPFLSFPRLSLIACLLLGSLDLLQAKNKELPNLSLDCVGFEQHVLKNHPILQEQSIQVVQKQLELERLKRSVLLPKFEVGMATGPAPGLRVGRDTSFVYENGVADPNTWVWDNNREFDFKSWGPFFGIDVTVAQPLNVYRYRAGTRAGALNIKISEAEYYQKQMKVSLEAQEVYYGFLLAQKLHEEAIKATEDLEEAEELIEELLDEESEAVSQKDLLKLKAGRYELDKGLREAKTGLRRAQMGSSFFLGLPSSDGFYPKDSLLIRTKISLPPLDTLKLWALEQHPDLQRLQNGLAARQELLKVAQGELGPDFFLFGRFQYSRVWSPKRNAGERDVFSTDPLNKVSGLAGFGLKFQLNLWSRYQNYKKEELELKKLQKTEVYAVQGILLRLEEAYLKHLETKGNLGSAKDSRRASEALLKSAAIDYDLDPSLASEMVEPYKKALIARKNYYQELYRYNVSIGQVLYAAGWTLSDYLSKVSKK